MALGHHMPLVPCENWIPKKAVHAGDVYYRNALADKDVEVIEYCRVDRIERDPVVVAPRGRLTLEGINTVILCAGYGRVPMRRSSATGTGPC